MRATTKSLFRLTAADLMTRDVLRLPRKTSPREAARLLFQSQVSGAPVVDDQGRCVGVLSATDFVRKEFEGLTLAVPSALLLTCPFPVKSWGPDDEAEQLAENTMDRYMTADPVTVAPETSIYDLARMMTDAHVHRILVVNENREPVGIVSSTDILAAVADAGRRPETATPTTSMHEVTPVTKQHTCQCSP